MPNQSTPEIERLREQSWQEEYYTPGGPRKHPPVVDLDDAIQAVRDTEARTVREIVEALRGKYGCTFGRDIADDIERTFLNGEGSE